MCIVKSRVILAVADLNEKKCKETAGKAEREREERERCTTYFSLKSNENFLSVNQPSGNCDLYTVFLSYCVLNLRNISANSLYWRRVWQGSGTT